MVDARNLHDYDLLHAAELFLAHGLNAEADQVVRERAGQTENPQIVTWLKERAENAGTSGRRSL